MKRNNLTAGQTRFRAQAAASSACFAGRSSRFADALVWPVSLTARCAVKAVVLFAALLLLLQFSPSVAHAASKPDLGQKGSLTLACVYDSTPVSDVECEVYEIACFESDGSFSLTKDFGKSGLEVNSVSSAGAWRSLAQQALDYAQGGKIAGAKLKANKLGFAYLDKLEPGLYLVNIAEKKLNGYRYASLPVVLSVPSADAESEADGSAASEGDWTYNVVAQPKFERTKLKGGTSAAIGTHDGGTKSESADESHGLLQTSDADRLFFVVGLLAMLVGAIGIARAARYRLKQSE